MARINALARRDSLRPRDGDVGAHVVSVTTSGSAWSTWVSAGFAGWESELNSGRSRRAPTIAGQEGEISYATPCVSTAFHASKTYH